MPTKEEYWANPEKYRQKALEWQQKNPDSHRKANREHKERNREKINKEGREYYQRNRGKVLLSNLIRREENPMIDAIHQYTRYHFPLASECELCPEDDKRTENLEHHHPDYDYPEIFVTCCRQCHKWIEVNES